VTCQRPVLESVDAKAPARRPPTERTVALGHLQLGPHDSRSVARRTRRRRHTKLVTSRRNDCFRFVCDQWPGRAEIAPSSGRPGWSIIWLELADGVELVIHAMTLRRAFYDLLPFPGEDNHD
jgi:hypothetical protein